MSNSKPIDYKKRLEDAMADEEKIEKERASKAGFEVLQEYVEQVLQVQDQFSLSNEDTLSSSLIYDRRIPSGLKKDIEQMRYKLQIIIRLVAENVEEIKYERYLENLKNVALTEYQNKKIEDLYKGERNAHISCQIVKSSYEVFSEMNKLIIKEIKTLEKKENKNLEEKQRGQRLLLGNAIFLFELAAFTLESLKSFKLEGFENIDSLCKEMTKKIEISIEKASKVETKMKNLTQLNEYNKQSFEKRLFGIQARKEALYKAKNKWDTYLQDQNKIKNNFQKFLSNFIQILEIIKDDSESQLDALDLIRITGAIEENLESVRMIVTTINDMELVPLTPDILRELFNISDIESNTESTNNTTSDNQDYFFG